MASTDITAPIQHEQPPVGVAPADEHVSTPFQRLSERLKGTVVILGDIVNSDPDDWGCESE